MGETRGDSVCCTCVEEGAQPLKSLRIGKTLGQALHRVLAQNQVLPLQNIVHVGALCFTVFYETHQLRVVEHALHVPRGQIEVGVLLLPVDDHRQVVADHLRQRGIHRSRLRTLFVTPARQSHLHAARVHDQQVLLLPLQRQCRAQTQRANYTQQESRRLPLKGSV